MTLDPNTIAAIMGGEVTGPDSCAVPGPGHSPQDRSLSVKINHTGDDVVVHSFAGDDPIKCLDYVRVKCGLPKWEPKRKENGKGKSWTLICEHTYHNAEGAPYLLVRKCLDENGRKQYPQKHWEGSTWIRKPAGPKVPYRLPELIAAPLTTPVHFCEGERDADNAAKLGFVATTASEGAAAPWDKALTPWFKDRPVVILPDADDVGRKHAQKVARALDGVASSVRVVDLYPDRDDGSDVSDFLRSDTSGARLAKLAREAPLWTPAPDGDSRVGTKDDDELITELAALPRLEYARRRKDAARQLGITVADLDKVVAEARGKDGKDDDLAPGLYDHWRVEQCEEPVDGDALLHALVAALRRYVAIPDEQALVVALWIVLTWLHAEVAVHSPILMVTSPQPNSGKTTLLKVVSFLVYRGISSVSITGPALFRSIEKWCPTFIIDEADTAFVNNDDLKEVINSGWTRGDTVIRCDPDTHDPRPYPTFCPKALGMIGRKLPAATLSRAFTIAMQRKRPNEHTDDFDYCDNETFARLRSQLLRWTSDKAEALKKTTPEVPSGFHNRTRANWWLLLAIAEQAGGGWKLAVRKAALEIEQVAAEADPEIGIQLLSDIRDIFDRNGANRLTTKMLLAELTVDEEGPWHSYGKGGKSLTDRQLRRLLKDFRRGYGIKSKSMRIDGIAGTPKGYDRADFESDFAAYLSSVAGKSTSQSATTQQAHVFNGLEPQFPATTSVVVADKSEPNLLENNTCCGVTDGEPQLPATERNSADQQALDEDRSCRWCGRRFDGTEQFCCVGDESVWLHPACQRPFAEAGGRP